MIDIVERLRNGVYGTNRIPLCAEAAEEIERLRSALLGLLEFPGGQYSECDGFDAAWAAAQASLTPNV